LPRRWRSPGAVSLRAGASAERRERTSLSDARRAFWPRRFPSGLSFPAFVEAGVAVERLGRSSARYRLAAFKASAAGRRQYRRRSGGRRRQ
jgi:hypothetical protein